jgi:hypothetical protein
VREIRDPYVSYSNKNPYFSKEAAINKNPSSEDDGVHKGP